MVSKAYESDKPIVLPVRQNLTNAQGSAKPQFSTSFEDLAVAYGASEAVDVQGAAYVFAYGGGAVTCADSASGSFVALEGPTGVAVVVTTARLIDVRGVRFIKFASTTSLVVTG